MASIEINVDALVAAVAEGVKQALAGVSTPGGGGDVHVSESNAPREPFGVGHAGWGAAGAPVVFEIFDDKGVAVGHWGLAGNILWKIDEGNVDENHGWHRVRISQRQFFLMYVRYCQIMRVDGDFKNYKYDKPLGS